MVVRGGGGSCADSGIYRGAPCIDGGAGDRLGPGQRPRREGQGLSPPEASGN